MWKNGADRPIEYAVTPMRNGRKRAECHVEGCGWWADTDTFNEAEIALRSHVAVHLGVVWEPRRAEVQLGRRA